MGCQIPADDSRSRLNATGANTPKKAKIRLIVSPGAKTSGKVTKLITRAIGELGEGGVRIETLVAQSAKDSERWAKEAQREEITAVIAVGGDGTLHQVVNGVMAHDAKGSRPVSVGVIPAGTGNDFAAGLGIRKRDAYRVLMGAAKDHTMTLDLGKIRTRDSRPDVHDERHFVNFATCGFGAEATRSAPRWLKSSYGANSYFINGARQLISASTQNAALSADGWHWEGSLLALALGNASQAGGGCVLCPEAKLDDGKLDLLIIPANVELYQLLNSWISGPIATLKKLLSLNNPLDNGIIGYILRYYKNLVIRRRVEAVDVQFDDPIKINLDGEPIAPCSGFSLTAVPASLSFVTPWPPSEQEGHRQSGVSG